jgi:hypothetical protein
MDTGIDATVAHALSTLTPETLADRLEFKKPKIKSKTAKRVKTQGTTKKVLFTRTVETTRRPYQDLTEREIRAAQPLITNVIDVPKEQQEQYVAKLQALTTELTSFLLIEVAPYYSALESAKSDASESMQIITGVQEANFSFGKAEALIRSLPELKTLDWLCTKLQLPEDIRANVLSEYFGHDQRKNHTSQLSQLLKLLSVPRQEERASARMRPTPAGSKRRPPVDSAG